MTQTLATTQTLEPLTKTLAAASEAIEAMTETLQEFCDSRGVRMRVDRGGGRDPGSENPRTRVAQRPHLSARGPGARRPRSTKTPR